ncbi:MAG: transposase, partial [Myxococcales bacterium]|nr:transposase [Myxococcales bacterium]
MTSRKRYTREFKLDAVRLVTEQGYGCAEAARNLGINANMLNRWVRTRGGLSIVTQGMSRWRMFS